ncbi:hypothetical protein ACIPYS_17700 [Kitasatospora sp. NPDC089913]|uniref:Lsr2 family DNA-binding protein n=1 Tax=Kitasatospora sp. NPDC089913 TaxID=3364080 RepID=UPI003817E39D
MTVEPTDEEVRAYMVEIGMRDRDNTSEVTPPEIRYFQNYKPAHDARTAKERAEQEQRDARWVVIEESSQRAREHAHHMKACRVWGNANGFKVGTRGAIPKEVRQAYKEATGVEL